MRENIFCDFDLTDEIKEVVLEKFNQCQYTDVIKDAFLFLTTYIREASGEGGDGVNLITKAFGGKAPQLMVNSMTTDTELSIQEGIYFILRGIYQTFRNPRNHEQYTDDMDTCIRIIVIIDSMYKYIKEKRQNFSVESMVETVFDPFFVDSSEYADSLVENIPEAYKLEVFKEVLDKFLEGDRSKIRVFFFGLYKVMNQSQLEQAGRMVGEKIRGKEPKEITYYLKILRPIMWSYLPRDVKIRTENMIVTEAAKGEVKNNVRTNGNPIGTWGNVFWADFGQKEQLKEVLLERLWDSRYSQDFVSKFYLTKLPLIFTDEEEINEAVDGLMYATIVNGATGMRERLLGILKYFPEEWKKAIEKAAKLIEEDQPFVEELLKSI